MSEAESNPGPCPLSVVGRHIWDPNVREGDYITRTCSRCGMIQSVKVKKETDDH